jgi:phosphoribosylformylglycinamidine synthase
MKGSGTELAISESQERMAVVTEREHAAAFIAAAQKKIWKRSSSPEVTAQPRLVMHCARTAL